MTNKTTTLRPLLVAGLDRRVRHPPELPDENRRECLIELHDGNGYFLAQYNEVIGRWCVAQPSSIGTLNSGCVLRWAYIDELMPNAEIRGGEAVPLD